MYRVQVRVSWTPVLDPSSLATMGKITDPPTIKGVVSTNTPTVKSSDDVSTTFSQRHPFQFYGVSRILLSRKKNLC